MGRVFFSILMNATFQIGLMDVYYFYIINASSSELKYILIYPLPMAYTVVGVFCAFIYLHCRPILHFIDMNERGEKFERDRLFRVQKRLINLPYFIAGASFPAFIVGGVLATVVINSKAGWHHLNTWHYGFLGGFYAGLLAIPTSIFAINWAAAPVLNRTLADLPGLDASRTAGFRISLRNKFIMNTLALVLAISGYCVVLGYSQADMFLKNMTKMEKLLTPDAASSLVDKIGGVTDDRIGSSRYFQNRMGTLKTFFLCLVLFGLLLSFVMSIAVTKQITMPLKILQAATEKVKEGNYAEPARMVTNDELAELGEAFNRMTNELVLKNDRTGILMGSINDAARTLTPMSKQLVSVAEQQSSSSIEQSSAAEEAAISGQEIASVAKNIAENASEVAGFAEEWLKFTQDGRKLLDQTRAGFNEIEQTMNGIVEAMNVLVVQSEEIEEIVQIIDAISEKTMLLSLNAALEAVGAGAQGKRFAVVSKEVQRLASNSARSARQIHKIVTRIRDSLGASTNIANEGSGKVYSGRGIVEGLTKRFEEIFNAGSRAAGRLKEIDIMTSQQASASNQMAQTMVEVKVAAQQGSQDAEEIRNSMINLKKLIEQLNSNLGG